MDNVKTYMKEDGEILVEEGELLVPEVRTFKEELTYIQTQQSELMIKNNKAKNKLYFSASENKFKLNKADSLMFDSQIDLSNRGENLLACNQCGKVFSKASNLKIHKYTHRGEKPHLTAICVTRLSLHQAPSNHTSSPIQESRLAATSVTRLTLRQEL